MKGSTFVASLIVAALMGAVTNQFLVRRAPAPAPAPPTAAPPTTEVVLETPKRSEFPLTRADEAADRETPAIVADAKGRVLLAYATQTGPLERTITLARSGDGGRIFGPTLAWRKVPIFKFTSKPKADPKGGGEPAKGMAFSTHVLPRLSASGETITLGWVEAIDGGPKVAYFVATSTDGGATFSEPRPVHGPLASKPGFTTLSVGEDGTTDAAWLDGRAGGGQRPFVSTAKPGAPFSAEAEVYAGPTGAGVCPCCDLATARVPGGPLFVAFRDNDADRRDIAIARSKGGDAPGFDPPVTVGSHRWSFKGCPHDGPSLALWAGRLQVAWMDRSTGTGRVYLAGSDPNALRFEPKEIDPASKGSQGHPRLVPVGKVLAAIWDESLDPAPVAAPAETGAGAGDGHGHAPSAPISGSGRATRLAWSVDGSTFSPSRAVDPRPGSFQVNPAATGLPDGSALVAWSELDESGKRIVVSRVAPPEPSR